MKIITQNLAYSELTVHTAIERILKFEPGGGGCEISLVNSGFDVRMTLADTDLEDNSSARLYCSDTGQGFFLIKDWARWRDVSSFLREVHACHMGAIAQLYKFGGKVYLFTSMPVLAEDFDCVADDGKDANLLQKHIEDFRPLPFLVKDRAKAELFHSINPVEILAALEKQVDLLSELVLSMAELVPQDKLPAWLPAIKAMSASTSSLQFKSPEEAVSSVAADKAKLRVAQAAYFDACAKGGV